MKHKAAPYGLSVRKQTIARHFAHASDYDQHANIQQQVCQQLLENIAYAQQNSVLEIGAGTGQMTRLLAAHLQSKRWLINELGAQQTDTLQSILPSVQALAQQFASVAIGDAETIDLGDQHSLIVSANAVQWFDDPLNFIAQSATRLQVGGQLLFNTFTPENFLQIKALTGQGLEYPTVNAWQLALDNAGFGQVKMTTRRFDLQFYRPYDVLKHMKLTGVSTNQTQKEAQSQTAIQTPGRTEIKPSTKPFIWTKSRLQQFEAGYWQQFAGQDDNGQPCVTLTYEVLMVSAFKL
ncbi:methyltransferase domain-containing protein [Psychrobacter sp. CAL346-MNA-CIBAN-0220]|uniref:methyltransferase domain-containing protein n=1 Tax=Psychrobacter sp. CAL346-MNA-CIBAN-0220 TaxID=3140457 RepID=UPI00331AA5AC